MQSQEQHVQALTVAPLMKNAIVFLEDVLTFYLMSVFSRHILIVIAVAYCSTLIAYLDANYEIPYSLPGLQFWPCDEWAFGLPHIVLKGTSKTQKQC